MHRPIRIWYCRRLRRTADPPRTPYQQFNHPDGEFDSSRQLKECFPSDLLYESVSSTLPFFREICFLLFPLDGQKDFYIAQSAGEVVRILAHCSDGQTTKASTDWKRASAGIGSRVLFAADLVWNEASGLNNCNDAL
jgi:hypothetical protein